MITGESVADIKKDLVQCAKKFAKEHQCICVLKDARTVVTDGMDVYINSTGNDGMSTGGSGDVLTGLMAGFTAMGIDAFEAACLAVYVHGKAGDIAALKRGKAGMTASDIAKAAVMPDQVDEQIKAKRSAQLIELGEKKRAAYEQSFQGKEVEVLVEEDMELNGKEVQTGHTKEYMKIALETNENLKNSIVKVQIGKDSQIIH